MKDVIFAFKFGLGFHNPEKEGQTITKAFIIRAEGFKNLLKHADEYQKEFDEEWSKKYPNCVKLGDIDDFYSFHQGNFHLDKVGELEEYGVHDAFGFGDEEFIGFNSYEVEEDKIDELMTKWNEWYKEFAGEENVTPVVQINENDVTSLDDFYRLIEEKYVGII